MAATGVILPGIVLPGIVLPGDVLSGAGGSRMLLENGTHQERDRATGRLSVLQFERYAIDLGGIGDSPAERVTEAAARTLGELLAGESGLAPSGRGTCWGRGCRCRVWSGGVWTLKKI